MLPRVSNSASSVSIRSSSAATSSGRSSPLPLCSSAISSWRLASSLRRASSSADSATLFGQTRRMFHAAACASGPIPTQRQPSARIASASRSIRSATSCSSKAASVIPAAPVLAEQIAPHRPARRRVGVQPDQQHLQLVEHPLLRLLVLRHGKGGQVVQGQLLVAIGLDQGQGRRRPAEAAAARCGRTLRTEPRCPVPPPVDETSVGSLRGDRDG